ncbi:MAG TPA: penicillin-binding protein 2 [Actinomycetota bacterium]|jgi:cell division protein FtsI (penicillin-binding protein 3)|nr:penicillin-binding protein 2 [Actinomycetota bacterium]
MRPPAGRLLALLAGFVLAFLSVGGRLVVLQLRESEEYEALAHDQRVHRIELPATRGSILDRAGRVLALSLPAAAVYADPQLVRDPADTASRLAPLLDIPSKRVRRSISAPGRFVYLARRVDLDVARRIDRLGLPGIGLLDESKRHYPAGGLGSQVVGFVGVDDVGLAGLELEYDELLAGRPGEMVVEQDPAGRPIPQGERKMEPPSAGADLVLTIDRDLQYQAQRALAASVQANQAKGGSVVIMDPATGEILAMATYPWFDANRFSEAAPEVIRNRAVTDVYEPGSVNKVITAAGALEEGIIGLREVLRVPDHHLLGDKVFHDAHPHPVERMTLADVIAQSSNIGTIMVADRLGKERLDAYLRRFGFGEETKLRFPGEADGILLDADDWWVTSMGTIPIGQGIAVTPLQMLSVYATVANEGVRVEPTLVRGHVEPGGRFVRSREPVRRRVVSVQTARILTRMLAHAVREGTGQAAEIPGYWVAGKTGTARKPLEDALGYSDRYVASFLGFAPARHPRVVVAAILDEPVTVYGGIAAAPLFREVTRFALAHLQVAPERPPRVPPVAERPCTGC